MVVLRQDASKTSLHLLTTAVWGERDKSLGLTHFFGSVVKR
jgi:hypothetical protein